MCLCMRESPSLGFHDTVLPNSLDHSHVSPTCSQSSLSPKYFLAAPIDNPKICDSNVYLGHRITSLMCLVGMLMIMHP